MTRVEGSKGNPSLLVNGENRKTVKIKVEKELPEMRFSRGDEVRPEVFVPKKSTLEIQTRRKLRVEGISGQIKLTTENRAEFPYIFYKDVVSFPHEFLIYNSSRAFKSKLMLRAEKLTVRPETISPPFFVSRVVTLFYTYLFDELQLDHYITIP